VSNARRRAIAAVACGAYARCVASVACRACVTASCKPWLKWLWRARVQQRERLTQLCDGVRVRRDAAMPCGASYASSARLHLELAVGKTLGIQFRPHVSL
jgi:hypothetical protein